MKYCDQCGELIPDNAKYCSECGSEQGDNLTGKTISEKMPISNSNQTQANESMENRSFTKDTNKLTDSEEKSEPTNQNTSSDSIKNASFQEQEKASNSALHSTKKSNQQAEKNNNQQKNAQTSKNMHKKAPTSKKSSFDKIKKYLYPGIAGFVGAALFMGGYGLVTQNGNNAGQTEISQTTENNTSKSKSNSNNTSAVVNKVQDAVVSINSKQKQSTNQQSTLDSLFGENQSGEDAAETVSQGSGVIYKKEGDKAYIVTNNHVIQDADEVEVLLHDKTTLKAKVVGKDAYSDLAVLSIDSSKVKAVAEFGDSSKVEAGDTAIAMGSPLGSDYAGSVTEGIVSAKDRTIQVPLANSNETRPLQTIQTDAAINSGNSGGPLLNGQGQIIGINSVKYSANSGSLMSNSASVEGMGFAIPSNQVVTIINQLVKDGKISRPMLGVEFVDLAVISEQDKTETLKLPKDVQSGALITKTVSGGPAEKAGLKAKDVLVEIDGEKIDASNVKTKLFEKKVGDSIEVKYYRDGKLATATVKLTKEQADLEQQQQKQQEEQQQQEQQQQQSGNGLEEFFQR